MSATQIKSYVTGNPGAVRAMKVPDVGHALAVGLPVSGVSTVGTITEDVRATPVQHACAFDGGGTIQPTVTVPRTC